MPFTVKKAKGIDKNDLFGSVVDLAKYVEDEFAAVASALQGNDPFDVMNVAPKRPRQGMLNYADGTHWNPGNGEGFYQRTAGGVWVPSFVKVDGTNITLSGAGVITGKSWSVNFQYFTSNGTYTPTAGMVYCILHTIGGGGGGGGCAGVNPGMGGGGGGGGGGYARKLATAAAIGASQAVTIGNGGLAGPAGNNAGGTGGTTSIGSLCSASGGLGGTGQNGIATVGSGNTGGGLVAGDFGVAGGNGQNSNYNSAASGNQGSSGMGGNAALGYGAGARSVFQSGGSAIAGQAGTVYGGGGSGGSFCAVAANAAGGAGGKGVAWVQEFIFA